MEVSGSNGLKYDIEEQALKGLLDAFGSAFSLQEIAFAYSSAGRNVDLAGEMLYDKQGSASTSSTHSSNGDAWGKESSESSYDDVSESSDHANGKFIASKIKNVPVSAGSVSSVLGKDYVKSIPRVNGSCVTTKPLKLDSKELPMSEIWGEEPKATPLKDNLLSSDMEDFLFKMLGEGFQLSRDVIKQVLDNCGYDMEKSMLKILDASAETSDKRLKLIGKSAEKFTDMCPNSEGLSPQKKLQRLDSLGGSGNGDSQTSGREPPRRSKQKNALEMEVLTALFNAPDKYEEPPKRIVRPARSSRAPGYVVSKPLMESIPEHNATKVQLPLDYKDDEDEEGGYQSIRKAVIEYRSTMKEYYKAAVEAYQKKEKDRAGILMEKGHFFRAKAREAEEEANQMIFVTRRVEAETETETETLSDDMVIDLHDRTASEAIRLLKCHIPSLSGIPSMKYLKVIIDTTDEDKTKGARKRRIMKLLDEESIKWIEEGTAGTILICLDTINPKRLSFVKKE